MHHRQLTHRTVLTQDFQFSEFWPDHRQSGNFEEPGRNVRIADNTKTTSPALDSHQIEVRFREQRSHTYSWSKERMRLETLRLRGAAIVEPVLKSGNVSFDIRISLRVYRR